LYQEDSEAYHEEMGHFDEYGLGFDYIEPYTFSDQRAGYCRWQICWGGPAEEFRFFIETRGDEYVIHDIEYWFLDWGCGKKRLLQGEDYDLLANIFDNYGRYCFQRE